MHTHKGKNFLESRAGGNSTGALSNCKEVYLVSHACFNALHDNTAGLLEAKDAKQGESCSSLQALDNAKIEWKEKEASKLDLSRCGILIGTAMGGMQTFATACEDLAFKVPHPPPPSAPRRESSALLSLDTMISLDQSNFDSTSFRGISISLSLSPSVGACV
jgi:hypothetical protein